MNIVSLRTFADEVGVSLTAVQKAIRTGRIVAAGTNERGHSTGIDLETQRDAFAANSKTPQRRPNTIAGGRPRKDGAPPALPATAKAEPTKKPEEKGMALADIQKARELTKLQLDTLELKKKQGELISAADVEKQGHAIATGVISTLYNIPDRVSDEVAGMSDPHAIHKLLLREIDIAVQSLRETYAS